MRRHAIDFVVGRHDGGRMPLSDGDAEWHQMRVIQFAGGNIAGRAVDARLGLAVPGEMFECRGEKREYMFSFGIDAAES